MTFFDQSDEYRPLFWIQGRPIYVTTLILLLNIAAFALTALAIGLLGDGVTLQLTLDTYSVLHYGQVWRLVSYIIFLPIQAISFIFSMGFLFYFGRQVEEYVGRNTYIKLFAALVLIPAVLLCLIGLVYPTAYMGGYGAIFGIFVAFATLYPGVEVNIWFVNLTAKYWAWVLLGVLSLMNVAYHQWIGLGGLWCDAAIGYLGMRLIGAGSGMAWFTDWLDERRMKRLTAQRNFKVVEEKKSVESIDAILEKISQQGVASLNAREKAALEQARAKLLQRDKS